MNVVRPFAPCGPSNVSAPRLPDRLRSRASGALPGPRGRFLALCTFAAAALAGCGTSPGSQGTQDLGPAPDMTVPPTRFGFVRAGATSFTSGPQTSTESLASALFIDTAAATGGCARTVVGECTMYRCTGTGFRYPGAGDVTIAPKSGGTGFTLAASADGYYTEQSNVAALFQAGQPISLGAAGKDVPVFKTDVTLPSDAFSITSPNASRSNLGWIISQSADFQVAWTTTASKVVLELTQGTLQAFGGVTIRCSFPGNAGSGKVPASMLASLKPTGTSNPARILIGPAASTQVQNMGWLIDTIAVGVGRSGEGTIQ